MVYCAAFKKSNYQKKSFLSTIIRTIYRFIDFHFYHASKNTPLYPVLFKTNMVDTLTLWLLFSLFAFHEIMYLLVLFVFKSFIFPHPTFNNGHVPCGIFFREPILFQILYRNLKYFTFSVALEIWFHNLI